MESAKKGDIPEALGELFVIQVWRGVGKLMWTGREVVTERVAGAVQISEG